MVCQAVAVAGGELTTGWYESLLTEALQSELDRSPDLVATTQGVHDADQAHVLSRHVQALVEQTLKATKDPAERLRIVNSLTRQLLPETSLVTEPPTQLLHLADTVPPGTTIRQIVRPSTPLSEAALLTNTHGEPSLGAELRAELDTADEVDLLCAFVKWHGLRLLEPELARLKRAAPRCASSPRPTWARPSERALDRLVREFGAEVKIQYDAQRTRLHAKAWLFRRDTDVRHGLRRLVQPVASGAARRRRVERPAVAGRHPDAAGEVPSHVRHLLERPSLRDRTTRTATATGWTTRWPRPRAARAHDRVTISLSGLEVRAVPVPAGDAGGARGRAQVHDRHRNLVVAATGTGKTVVAALDYRGLCEPTPANGRRCSSSLTARRSWSSPCGPTERCSPTPTSASCTSAEPAPSGGGTSSPACSR